MTERTLLLSIVLILASACGPSNEACGRYCVEIRTLFEAPCGSQHTGTPADCAAWVGKVSTMAKGLDKALKGKPVEPGVKETLPKLLEHAAAFESKRCADVHADNVSTTDERHEKCNEALIATRGDLGALYFNAQGAD